MALDPLRLTARLVGFALLVVFGLLFWMLHSGLPLAIKLKSDGRKHPGTSSAAGRHGGGAKALSRGMSEAEALAAMLGAEGQVRMRQDLTGDGRDELFAVRTLGTATGSGVARAVVLSHDTRGWRVFFDTADATTWSLALGDVPGARAWMHLAADADPAMALAQWSAFRVEARPLERIKVEPLEAGGRPTGAIYTFSWDGWRAHYEPTLLAAPPVEGALTPSPVLPKIDVRPSGG